MTKRDFKKELHGYHAKHHVLEVVEVPHMQYLMIDGHGDPNTGKDFQSAIAALYPVAYKLKFASKQELGQDYTVMPLEGQWWAEDMNSFTLGRDKSQWEFRLMIMQPEWITGAMFQAAVQEVAERHPTTDLARVRLEALHEGTCVQTLHVGSFDDETEILAKMHEFIPANDFEMTGKHHEIYFSDLRRVASHKLRTLLRQPVEQV